MTARDDAAGLRERVEALARLVEVECTHENRTGRDWCCSHCHSIAYAVRALLAESTPAPAPAADGGEVEAIRPPLVDIIHRAIEPRPEGGPRCPETAGGFVGCFAAANAILASDWLADIRRTARAEGAREALEAAADALEGGLGVSGIPQTLYDTRNWLRARAIGGPQ